MIIQFVVWVSCYHPSIDVTLIVRILRSQRVAERCDKHPGCGRMNDIEREGKGGRAEVERDWIDG